MKPSDQPEAANHFHNSRNTPDLRTVLRWAGIFLLLNLLVFSVYRAVFIGLFVGKLSFSNTAAILASGFRLDLALLAIELFLILTVALLTRFLYLRLVAVAGAVLTVMHLFLGVANLIFFHERNQHLWEMLFANISQPDQILNACVPYMKEAPFLTLCIIAGSIALGVLGIRKSRALSGQRIDLWSSRRQCLRFGAIWLVLLILPLDRNDLTIQRGWKLGWIPVPASSQHYMNFGSYLANQAVGNPLHDFVRFYLPAQLAGIGRAHDEDHLAPDVALATSQKLLGIETPSTADPFPLRKRSHSLAGVGLTNVILIQVEGLSQSMVHKTEGAKQVMPFLHQLSAESIYVPNLIQNYNATDGGVLSTITGTYKVFFNQDWKYFLPAEVNGYFASLPRILGKTNYHHFAFFGYRNRQEDFAAFFRNQGYATMGFPEFKALDLPDSLDALGLYDNVLFEVAGDVLKKESQPFSAYFMTATTHSPWVIPKGEPRPFSNDRFNAFHYLDHSIERFIASMRRSLPAFDHTLFVVTGDHTSITFGPGRMERLRIPLILYADRLKPLKAKWPLPSKARFGEVDIVPTILDLLDGEHTYSGLGRSILGAKPNGPGAISLDRFYGLYLKEDFALRYSPFAPAGMREQLFEIRDEEIIEKDIAAGHPEEFQAMSAEFFALYETSGQLTRKRRFFPAGQ